MAVRRVIRLPGNPGAARFQPLPTMPKTSASIPDSAAPISVLHVLAPASFGGLEQVVRSLSVAQADAGWRVGVAAVLSPYESSHPLILALQESATVRTFPLQLPGRAYGREVSAIVELCRSFKPRLLHSHGYRPDVLGGLAARRAGVPQVSTAHGFTGGGLKNRFFEWLDVQAWRRSDAVIAVSRPLASELLRRGVPGSRVHTVTNAWRPRLPGLDREEARRILGLPGEGVIVGWVGRLSREKGPDLMIEALAQLPSGAVELAMVGEGSDSGALKALAERRGLTDRVHWPGAVPDAGRLFKAFDCLVLSSRTEGTPIVLFEAMAAGVPVVATAVGGIPDVISAAEGWLVPPEDPAALARAIGAVVDDPRSAAVRGRAAMARLATAFSVDSWLAQHEEVYRQVLNSRPGG